MMSAYVLKSLIGLNNRPNKYIFSLRNAIRYAHLIAAVVFFFLHPSSQGCLITAWIYEAAQRVHSVTLLCCMCGVDAKAPVTAAPDGLKKKHHTRRIDVKTLRRFQLLYKCNNRQVAEAMFSVCVSLSHTHVHNFP